MVLSSILYWQGCIMDLLVVLLVYLTATRLYNKRVGILAAAFSAATVLQIQQSHFFTMDTFMNAFMFLAFYFTVRITTLSPSSLHLGEKEADGSLNAVESIQNTMVKRRGLAERVQLSIRNPLFLPSLRFGLSLGMAVASKLDAAPMAMTLPAALVLLASRIPPQRRIQFSLQAIAYLCLAAFTSLVVFRIFQPYAFSGPGFFGITPNTQWVTVQSAAQYLRGKGGVVVVATGNSGGLESIAANDSLLTVAATDQNDVRASFSSYGAYVDIAAPGVSVYTTTVGGGYSNASGTSFSSPVVAATAALMLSANSNLTPADVDSILRTTALDLGTAKTFVVIGEVSDRGIEVCELPPNGQGVAALLALALYEELEPGVHQAVESMKLALADTRLGLEKKCWPWPNSMV